MLGNKGEGSAGGNGRDESHRTAFSHGNERKRETKLKALSMQKACHWLNHALVQAAQAIEAERALGGVFMLCHFPCPIGRSTPRVAPPEHSAPRKNAFPRPSQARPAHRCPLPAPEPSHFSFLATAGRGRSCRAAVLVFWPSVPAPPASSLVKPIHSGSGKKNNGQQGTPPVPCKLDDFGAGSVDGQKGKEQRGQQHIRCSARRAHLVVLR